MDTHQTGTSGLASESWRLLDTFAAHIASGLARAFAEGDAFDSTDDLAAWAYDCAEALVRERQRRLNEPRGGDGLSG